jgi:glycosyltransferase involved in cell wall biosynthesis
MAVRAVGDLAQYYGDKQNVGDYDNGIWHYLLDIPFIGLKEEAQLYKTVIRTLWLEATGWSKEIRNRFPHVQQIGLSDHPISTHVSRLPAEQVTRYISDLQYLDAIMVLTEEEREWYQTAVPSKPVVRVGLPFPVESYEQRFGKYRDLEKIIVGLGVGASDNDRNFISSLLVFRKLQLNNPDLKGVFLSVPSQLVNQCSILADTAPNVYIHEREDMASYYEMLSQCKFVINLPDRNTPGRLQGEAAFFNIPVVGSNRLELQNELFPQWAVSPFSLEQAVEHCQWILDNQNEATALASLAHDKLVQNYNLEISKKKFEELRARL